MVDVGSGTGRSTFELAKTASLVIGIEPQREMRQVAIAKFANVVLPKSPGSIGFTHYALTNQAQFFVEIKAQKTGSLAQYQQHHRRESFSFSSWLY